MSTETESKNQESAESFKGYMAKVHRTYTDGTEENTICRVVNHGQKKDGTHLVKIRERYYIGMSGSKTIYGYRDPIWVKADRVLCTWNK